MKKAEVSVGSVYFAKVTNKRVEVRIDAERARGGWDATNLSTNKKIVIKSAQRLQAAGASGNAATASGEAETPASTAVLKKPRKVRETTYGNATIGDKKLSCVTAALKVLGESSDPLNTKELIEAMESKGYWSSPGGKTPHATLYSAILRELSKGHQSRFVKTERGRFTVRS